MQRLIVSQKIKSILRHIWLTKYLRFPTQPQQLAFAALTTAVKLHTAHSTYDGHGYNGQLVIADKNRSPKPSILNSRHSSLAITDKVWPQMTISVFLFLFFLILRVDWIAGRTGEESHRNTIFSQDSILYWAGFRNFAILALLISLTHCCIPDCVATPLLLHSERERMGNNTTGNVRECLSCNSYPWLILRGYNFILPHVHEQSPKAQSSLKWHHHF